MLDDDVKAFLTAHCANVAALEVLLVLRAHDGRDWSAEELARQTRGNAEREAAVLAAFRRQSLVVEPSPGRYRLAATAGLRERLDRLAGAFARAPLQVVEVIHAAPSETVQTFADAFRIPRR